MKLPTPHIEADCQKQIAKVVLMPGDPLRAQFIANSYLTEVKKINGIRNMLGYTGYYKNKLVTVMGSGMGMPSIGIYSYELFSFYDVDKIIRIGSCGSYRQNINLYDVIVVDKAYSESSFAKTAFDFNESIITANEEVVNELIASAKKINCPVTIGCIHSSDVFYRHQGNVLLDVGEKMNCLGVEMESFALFANAHFLGKKAGCILTVSDSLVTHEITTSKERQESFVRMVEIALETLE